MTTDTSPTEPVPSAGPPERPQVGVGRTGRALFAVLLACFVAIAWAQWEPYTFLHGDGAFYANINKAIWNDGTIAQDDYHPRSWLEANEAWNRELDQGWSNVSLGRDGRWMPKHSFVLPLFATPLYGLFGMGGLLAFHLLMLALMLFGAYHVAARWLPPGVAAAAAATVALQPVVSGDIYSYNNDAFYSAMLLLGTWQFFEKHAIRAGLLLGIGVWAKATNVLYVAPFAVWLLWQRDWRQTGRAIAAFALPCLLMLASNWYFYGGPFTSSYSNILVRHDGQLATESITEKMKEPVKEGLERIFENEREGIIPRMPLVFLAVPGALLMLLRRRERPMGLAFLAAWLAFAWFHARYDFTYARFFLPLAALGAVPTGVLLDRFMGLFAPERRLFEPVRSGRLNPLLFAAIGLGVVLLAWSSVRINPGPRGKWQMTHALEGATVTHRGKPCDYFNNMRQKFECRGDKGHQFFWGRATSEDQCRFDDEQRPMLWLHPSTRRGTRIIRFGNVPGGQLTLTYGLAETSRFDDLRLRVLVNDAPIDLPPITARNVLMEHSVPLGGSANSLTVEVESPPADWRHFCIDAVVR